MYEITNPWAHGAWRQLRREQDLTLDVVVSPEGLTYESDPRHVDLLESSMGLTVSNAVSTPGTSEPNADHEATKTYETAFQSGFGDNDGNGRQQRTW